MWTSSQSFGCDRKTRRSVEILKYVSERLGLFNFSCWPTSSCLLDGTVKLLLSRGLHCDDHSCSAEEEEKGPEGATGSVVHNNHSIIRPKGTPALFEVDRTQRAMTPDSWSMQRKQERAVMWGASDCEECSTPVRKRLYHTEASRGRPRWGDMLQSKAKL